MTERWQRELERIDGLGPSTALLDVARSGSRLPELGPSSRSRMAAAALAVILAAVAIGGAITLFRSARVLRPAGTSEGLTTANVNNLGVAWTASGSVGAVDQGMAFVIVNDQLRAYDLACGNDGRACDPRWTASVGPRPYLPVVTNHTVYVSNGPADDSTLDGFPVDCQPVAGPCRPSWRARSPYGVPLIQTVSDGFVIASCCGGGTAFGSSYPAVHSVYAYPADCTINEQPCRPAWHTEDRYDRYTFRTVVDGMVYVTSDKTRQAGVFAYPVNCRTDGKSCVATWSAYPKLSNTGAKCQIGGVAVSDGTVYVTCGGTLFAFDASCDACHAMWRASNAGNSLPVVAERSVYLSDGVVDSLPTTCRLTCSPSWIGRAPGDDVAPPPVELDGTVYVVSAEGGNGVYAFDASCSSGRKGPSGNCLPLWAAKTDGTITAGPVVWSDLVFVISTPMAGSHPLGPTKLYAFPTTCRPTACEPAGTWTAPSGDPYSSLTVNGSTILVSEKGTIYALQPGAGGSPSPLGATVLIGAAVAVALGLALRWRAKRST